MRVQPDIAALLWFLYARMYTHSLSVCLYLSLCRELCMMVQALCRDRRQATSLLDHSLRILNESEYSEHDKNPLAMTVGHTSIRRQTLLFSLARIPLSSLSPAHAPQPSLCPFAVAVCWP